MMIKTVPLKLCNALLIYVFKFWKEDILKIKTVSMIYEFKINDFSRKDLECIFITAYNKSQTVKIKDQEIILKLILNKI